MIRSLPKVRLRLLLPSTTRFISAEPGSKLGFQPSPSKDADALSHLLIAHHNPYHPIESSLQLAGTLTLTPSLTLQTLIRLKNHSKIAISFFLFARVHAHVAPDAETYDLMVDILGKVRQFDVVWQLIVEMDQRGVSPTTRTFGILMRRYIAAGFTRLAIRAFDDIEGFLGREANGEEFKMLLDTLCKYGYPKVVHKVHFFFSSVDLFWFNACVWYNLHCLIIISQVI